MSKTFTATNPATGQAVGNPIAEHSFEEATAAIAAAEKIKAKFAATTPTQRAALLNAIADSIESEKEALAQISHLETALPSQKVDKNTQVNRRVARFIILGTKKSRRVLVS